MTSLIENKIIVINITQFKTFEEMRTLDLYKFKNTVPIFNRPNFCLPNANLIKGKILTKYLSKYIKTLHISTLIPRKCLQKSFQKSLAINKKKKNLELILLLTTVKNSSKQFSVYWLKKKSLTISFTLIEYKHN